MEKGLIVFLNGTSSAGKTSISKSIIELSDKPFKSQFESMHANGSYDIEVNSDQMSAQECAKLIVDEIEKGTAFKAFQSLHL